MGASGSAKRGGGGGDADFTDEAEAEGLRKTRTSHPRCKKPAAEAQPTPCRRQKLSRDENTNMFFPFSPLYKLPPLLLLDPLLEAGLLLDDLGKREPVAEPPSGLPVRHRL